MKAERCFSLAAASSYSCNLWLGSTPQEDHYLYTIQHTWEEGDHQQKVS